jgi:GntR family transcriptional repressor for pyruvate dehydrogenase complex
MGMTERIRPPKLADSIAHHLERLILEGSLRPGERLLPERELAARFDVSRPSLREALDKLEGRGLLSSERGGATEVAPLLGEGFCGPIREVLTGHPEAVLDYLEFRRLVESSATALAALRATDIDRASLTRRFAAIEAANQAGDRSLEAEAGTQFHLAIYEASHSLVMMHVMRALMGLLGHDELYSRAMLYRRQAVRDLLFNQHRAILDAVLAGDPAAAQAAAEAHIDFTRDALREIAEADARLDASLSRIGGRQ